ncbi:MAG TPA: PAS domain S-box protein [Dehalococcoidia bacterium]|nr:PAS domain S-box protein [Dehalococcoidia bacterium]
MGEPVLNHGFTEEAAGQGDDFASYLLETLPTALVLTSPDTSIQYVNSALQQITQFTSNELSGCLAPYPWACPDVPDTTLKDQEKALDNGTVTTEKVICRKNGTRCWIEQTITPVNRGSDTGYFLQSWVDITKRKEAERLLGRRTKELQWQSAINKEASRTALSLDDTLQRLVILLHRALPHPENMCARMIVNNREFSTPNFKETPWHYAWSITLRGVNIGRIEVNYLQEPSTAEEKVVSREERFLIDIVASRVAEIVERMQASDIFQILAHSSLVGVYVERDGKFLFVNPQVLKYTGYSEDELLGTNTLDIVYPADRAQVRQNTVSMLKGQLSAPYECRVVRKDGQIRWILEKTTSIIYEGKRAVLGYLMDNTERKELEWDVAKYKELDQMKRNLLSTVSHELRTPLSNIKGYANMLIDYEQKLNDQQRREFVKGIDKDTDRLTDFVNDLLNLSRLEAGLLSVEKKLYSISSLLREVVDEASIRWSSHHIKLKITRSLPRVNIDPGRIRQVLDNLIDNACKYSAHNTEVVVSGRKTGSELHIGIHDQGIGIPAGDLEKVFDPMYRIDREHIRKVPGIGLGLSVCKGLVDAHNGHIWFESEVGKGSTCWFTLPLDEAKASGTG